MQFERECVQPFHSPQLRWHSLKLLSQLLLLLNIMAQCDRVIFQAIRKCFSVRKRGAGTELKLGSCRTIDIASAAAAAKWPVRRHAICVPMFPGIL